MTIKTICVCGAGTMGSGIALVAAQSGFDTLLYEVNAEVLKKASASMEKNLQSLAEKGKISDTEKEKILHRIRFISDIQTCLADLFIEAIIENPEAKVALFNQLAEFNLHESIFASNTSSLSVNELAAKIKRPERFIGMHFFNPATVMKLVEVVNTNYTNEEITRIICELARQMGKTPVVCKDSPGFIVNRVARPYYIESIRLVEEGIADLPATQAGFSKIDSLLEATGFKLGPFQLMDLIGNDVNYAVSCSVYERMNEPERLRPSPIQKEKVSKNELGRKTGKGYYKY